MRPAPNPCAEVAKTSLDVKNYTLVPAKPSSPRDSQPDDLDTVLVVSSEEISKARAEAESLTSETATADCHPVILDDSEEDTDRFAGKDASSSGLVKNPLKVSATRPPTDEEDEPETATFSLKEPLPTLLDESEAIEISSSGLEPESDSGVDEMPTREAAIAAAIAAAKAESPPGPRPSLSEESTSPKERKLARFDDETKPIPKPDLAAVGAVLETVPLEAALVKNVLAQVDARAAARAAGLPVPQFQVPTAAQPVHQAPQHFAAPPQPQMHMQAHPRTQAPTHAVAQPPAAVAPRRIGVEILITLVAFLFVAVPSLYYLYVSFSQR